MRVSSRNAGLDIARSLAILLVLVCHEVVFFVNQDPWLYSVLGVVGVEVFFVLSGFLIGKIILDGIVKNASGASLSNFYMRRWLRTLPLYYLVLILNSLVLKTGIPLSNFFFLQNFNETSLGFLAVSWSLSIEEWFYLLFPAILFVALKLLDKKFSRKSLFFAVAITIGMISFLLRCYHAIAHQPPWDFGVRKQVFLRLDSIMTGVILVGIKQYYGKVYEKFTATKWPLILSLAGFAAIGFVYLYILGEGKTFESTFWKIFLFTSISLTCAMLISFLDTNAWINTIVAKSKVNAVFGYFSRTSYSIYLVHFTIMFQVLPKAQGWVGLLWSVGIALAISTVLHLFVEVPIMNLRDKIRIRSIRKANADLTQAPS